MTDSIEPTRPGHLVEVVSAADALTEFRATSSELIGSDLEPEVSARAVATWLAGYDPETSHPTMRRKARALSRMLFGVEDEDAAPRARLAMPGGIEAIRSLRSALLEEVTKYDATGGQEGRSRRTANSLLVALRAMAKTLWQLGALDAEKLERIPDASKTLPNATLPNDNCIYPLTPAPNAVRSSCDLRRGSAPTPPDSDRPGAPWVPLGRLRVAREGFLHSRCPRGPLPP